MIYLIAIENDIPLYSERSEENSVVKLLEYAECMYLKTVFGDFYRDEFYCNFLRECWNGSLRKYVGDISDSSQIFNTAFWMSIYASDSCKEDKYDTYKKFNVAPICFEYRFYTAKEANKIRMDYDSKNHTKEILKTALDYMRVDINIMPALEEELKSLNEELKIINDNIKIEEEKISKFTANNEERITNSVLQKVYKAKKREIERILRNLDKKKNYYKKRQNDCKIKIDKLKAKEKIESETLKEIYSVFDFMLKEMLVTLDSSTFYEMFNCIKKCAILFDESKGITSENVKIFIDTKIIPIFTSQSLKSMTDYNKKVAKFFFECISDVVQAVYEYKKHECMELLDVCYNISGMLKYIHDSKNIPQKEQKSLKSHGEYNTFTIEILQKRMSELVKNPIDFIDEVLNDYYIYEFLDTEKKSRGRNFIVSLIEKGLLWNEEEWKNIERNLKDFEDSEKSEDEDMDTEEETEYVHLIEYGIFSESKLSSNRPLFYIPINAEDDDMAIVSASDAFYSGKKFRQQWRKKCDFSRNDIVKLCFWDFVVNSGNYPARMPLVKAQTFIKKFNDRIAPISCCSGINLSNPHDMLINKCLQQPDPIEYLQLLLNEQHEN